MNISYSRSESAPYSATTSSGLMTLPRLLDIFSLFSPRIMPWLTSFWNGSGVLTMPRSKSTLCQNREYKQVQHGVLGAADVEIDRHPRLFDRRVDRRRRRSSDRGTAGSTSTSRPTAASCSSRACSACRRSTGYSQSSRRFVQRRLGPAVRLEVVEVRQVDRQLILVGTARTRPVGLPLGIELVQDRKRLAPETLPAEEPVAELVVHRLAAEALLRRDRR